MLFAGLAAQQRGPHTRAMDGELRESAQVDASDALQRAKAGPSVAQKKPGGWQGPAKFLLLFGLGAGAVTMALTSNETPFVYSMDVNAVMSDQAAVAGRTLRVEGELRDGSIQFREEPCEYRFVLTRAEQAMNVTFPQCVVPDTFRDGMGISVVVEGELASDGHFEATQVIPRCPSRYEMDQRQQSGEAAPHAMPAS